MSERLAREVADCQAHLPQKTEIFTCFECLEQEIRKLEREHIWRRLQANICFDALRDGYCTHHGGKCTDLLGLLNELQ